VVEPKGAKRLPYPYSKLQLLVSVQFGIFKKIMMRSVLGAGLNATLFGTGILADAIVTKVEYD
jgi:hypothetical protein